MRLLSSFVLCLPLLAAAATPDAVHGLADAERAFAADGLRDGVQKSFLAHLAADAIAFRPFATNAPAWYAQHPDRGGHLYWAPQYLALSGAGDLGLSSGPWRFEGEHDGKPVKAFGHFFSLWRRDAQGHWQVVFDHGIGHGETAVENTPLVELDVATPHKALDAATRAQREQALAAADEALSHAVQQPGSTYAPVVQRDALWLRESALPSRAVPDTKPPLGSGPRTALGVAASGDFGYTLGGAAQAKEAGVYARVWRYHANGGWKLLADLTTPVP